MQIKKLKSFIKEREIGATYYKEELGGIDWLELPEYSSEYGHGWQSFVTIVNPENAPKTRNEIMEILQEMGVSTRPGTHAVHMLNYYKENFRLQSEDYPNARFVNDNSMAIPLHNRMTKEDYEYVVHCLKSIK